MPTRLLIGSEILDPDVVINEQFISPATITSHPVEQGSAASDHVQEQPLSIPLQLIVTESPLRQPVFGTGGAVLDTTQAVFVLSGSLRDRARLLTARLRRTRIAGELLTLESAREGTIRNLAVQNLNTSYTSLRSATISLTLVQIRVADARTVEIPPTLAARQKKKQDKGKQPARTATPQRRQSLLVKLSKSL